LARISRNLAKKTNNFDRADKEYAYAIWLIEKEFNVGRIEGDFPAMKFWNLLDEENGNRYKADTDPKKASHGAPATFR